MMVAKCLEQAKRSSRGRGIIRSVVPYYQTSKTGERVFRITDLQKVNMSDPVNGRLGKLQND